MARIPNLLDQWGNPMRKSELKREVAGPSLRGVRTPLTGHPGDGLNPIRLGSILKEADAGDPLRYLELAEVAEDRDPHYLGVLGTRRRSVSQLDITVEDASDDPIDVEIGEALREWIKRDELTDEMFNILDAIGKGYSFTEIIWDTSTGQWNPIQLKYRDPRWFTFDREDLDTPLMLDDAGQPQPLPAGKFIQARIAAKSGIAPRSGLARVILWCYLFKKYTERDWAIFTQTYGQPLRVGKYDASASEQDRETLFRAVANIAGDCAAIIPESMMIEFIETGSLGSSLDLYERRADWYDKQVSKAVLGQTATTDAETGGLGSGKEHRMVQEDIERADAKALAAVLNRDLVRPYVHLNWPGHGKFPRIVIARPETEDLKKLSDALAPLVDRGLEVDADDIRDKFGLRQPRQGANMLRPAAKTAPQPDPESPSADAKGRNSQFEPRLNTHQPAQRPETPLTAKSPSAGRFAPLTEAVDLLAAEAAPQIGSMLDRIEAMMASAGSLDELKLMLEAGFPDLDSAGLANVLGQAMTASFAGGMAMIEEEADGRA